jgi:phosphate/phosphite/phosphonate ABC transporter binding protein
MNRPLRFATFLAPNMYPVYQFIVEYISHELDISAELVVGPAFEDFASAEADVSFICGLPYILLADQKPPLVDLLAAPVLQGERYQDRPIYFSDVIVRQDSPHQTFADLRGHSWAYNEPYSQSGYGITRYWLLHLGETSGYFGKVVGSGAHQTSIRQVAAGEIDASAIDSQVLAIELRENPELAGQLRVIDALGPSTIQPVVARLDLPDSLKADVQAALLKLGDDPAARNVLAQGFVRRFAAVSDADYDDIRYMLASCQKAGFMDIR